jgi:hypothetical protein
MAQYPNRARDRNNWLKANSGLKRAAACIESAQAALERE